MKNNFNYILAYKDKVPIYQLEELFLNEVQKVAEFQEIKTFRTKGRKREYIKYKHAFLFYANHVGYSLNYLGKRYNCQHSTVINAIKNINAYLFTKDQTVIDLLDKANSKFDLNVGSI